MKDSPALIKTIDKLDEFVSNMVLKEFKISKKDKENEEFLKNELYTNQKENKDLII